MKAKNGTWENLRLKLAKITDILVISYQETIQTNETLKKERIG